MAVFKEDAPGGCRAVTQAQHFLLLPDGPRPPFVELAVADQSAGPLIKKNDTVEKERVRVQELKMLSGSKKSEEYLTMKLKSLGIDILNIEMEDELILEVINQLS